MVTYFTLKFFLMYYCIHFLSPYMGQAQWWVLGTSRQYDTTPVLKESKLSFKRLLGAGAPGWPSPQNM